MIVFHQRTRYSFSMLHLVCSGRGLLKDDGCMLKAPFDRLRMLSTLCVGMSPETFDKFMTRRKMQSQGVSAVSL